MTLAVGVNTLFDTYPRRRGLIATDKSGAYGVLAPFGLGGDSCYARVGMSL